MCLLFQTVYRFRVLSATGRALFAITHNALESVDINEEATLEIWLVTDKCGYRANRLEIHAS